MNAEERMTKGQLEEEIQYFRKIFQEIRLFPIGNISDIDEGAELLSLLKTGNTL